MQRIVPAYESSAVASTRTNKKSSSGYSVFAECFILLAVLGILGIIVEGSYARIIKNYTTRSLACVIVQLPAAISKN